MFLSKKEDILKRWKDLFKKVYNMEDSVNSTNTSWEYWILTLIHQE